MEEDLRAQEEFFLRQEKPSVEVIKEKTLPKKPSISLVSPVGEIRERTPSSVREVKETMRRESGFPEAQSVFRKSRGQQARLLWERGVTCRSGGKKSIFKQSMEAKARANAASEEVKELSEEEKKQMERSFSKEVSGEEIKRGVDAIMGQMSEQEILDAREELLHSLDPKLISFLMKRSQYKEVRGDGGVVRDVGHDVNHDVVQDMNHDINTNSEINPDAMNNDGNDTMNNDNNDIINNATNEEESQARAIANAIDYSTIRTESDLAAAVAQLPPSEQQKLAWTQPVPPSSSSEPRFHFDGSLLPPSAAATIAVSSGLYNHGEAADRPGYSLAELALLSRSAVSGQRVLALKTLLNVLRRRQAARLRGQTPIPAKLPVSVPRTLTLLIGCRNGAEEAFLALRCLEELCSSPAELERRLELNLSRGGFMYGHLQDAAALEFSAGDADDAFRAENCGNLFAMLKEAGILERLFAVLRRFSEIPTVLIPAVRVIQLLVESDGRFAAQLLDSAALFGALETLASRQLDPAAHFAAPALEPAPDPADSAVQSLRAFYLRRHAQSDVTAALQTLLLLEALSRGSRRGALRVLRSSAFPAVQQWLLVAKEVKRPQEMALEEAALNLWRLPLLYGLGLPALDPFLPAVVHIAQFHAPACRSLAWSLLELALAAKRGVTPAYFTGFANTLLLLAVETLNCADAPTTLLAPVAHFLATYLETLNDARESWESGDSADSWNPADFETQVLQLGSHLLSRGNAWLDQARAFHQAVCAEWNSLPAKPLDAEDETPFSSTERAFLSLADAAFAVVRFSLAGIQHSFRFVSLLQQTDWAFHLERFIAEDLWVAAQTSPHSASYTYLSRGIALAQAEATLLLHTVLGPTSPRGAAVWRRSWRVVQQLLPGDEFIALQLLLRVLLDAGSLRVLLEGRSPDAPLDFDLDTLSDLLARQLGPPAALEFSQTMYGDRWDERTTLQLLPRAPALPLLPTWFLLPFLKLRFRRAEQAPEDSPAVAAGERQAVALLQLLFELETARESPLEAADRPMRFYCLLHVACAGSDVALSPAVGEWVEKLLPLYRCGGAGRCAAHADCLCQLETMVPGTEMRALLEKVATRVVEEYYSCPMVMRLLLLFLHPCRDWNNRVLLLNFFLDNDCCAMLLAADSRESTDARLEETVHEQGLEAAARIYYRRYCDGYACVWEEREDVMEMILRYFEKSRGALRKGDSAVVVNGFLFQMLHYIACKLPRYQFFTRSLESLFDSIHVSRLLE